MKKNRFAAQQAQHLENTRANAPIQCDRQDLGRAFMKGTPEYWRRHAAQWEAQGKSNLAFMARRAAEDATVKEALQFKGVDLDPSRGDCLAAIGFAFDLMTPKMIRRWRTRMAARRRKIQREASLLPRIVFVTK